MSPSTHTQQLSSTDGDRAPFFLCYVSKSDARQRILSFTNIAIANKIRGIGRSNGCDMGKGGNLEDREAEGDEGAGTNWEMKRGIVTNSLLFWVNSTRK